MTKIYNKNGNSFINISEISNENIFNDFDIENKRNKTGDLIRFISQTATKPAAHSEASLLNKCITVLVGGTLSTIGLSLIKSIYIGQVTCHSDIIVDGANGLLSLFLGSSLIYRASI